MKDLKGTLKLPKDDPKHPYNIITRIDNDQKAMAQRIDNQAVTLNQLLDAVNRHFANPFATIGSVNIQLRAPTDDQAIAGQTIEINVVPSGVESESEMLARELEEVRQALRDKEDRLAGNNAKLAGKNDKVAERDGEMGAKDVEVAEYGRRLRQYENAYNIKKNEVVEMQRQLNQMDTVLAMTDNRITDLAGKLYRLQQQNAQTALVSHGTAAAPLTDGQPRPPPQSPDAKPTVEGQSKPSLQAPDAEPTVEGQSKPPPRASDAEPPPEDQLRSRPQDLATERPAKDQPQPQQQAPAAQSPAKSQPNPAPQAPAAKPPGRSQKKYRGGGTFTARPGASVLSKGGSRKKEPPVQPEAESSSDSENPEIYQPTDDDDDEDDDDDDGQARKPSKVKGGKIAPKSEGKTASTSKTAGANKTSQTNPSAPSIGTGGAATQSTNVSGTTAAGAATRKSTRKIAKDADQTSNKPQPKSKPWYKKSGKVQKGYGKSERTPSPVYALPPDPERKAIKGEKRSVEPETAEAFGGSEDVVRSSEDVEDGGADVPDDLFDQSSSDNPNPELMQSEEEDGEDVDANVDDPLEARGPEDAHQYGKRPKSIVKHGNSRQPTTAFGSRHGKSATSWADPSAEVDDDDDDDETERAPPLKRKRSTARQHDGPDGEEDGKFRCFETQDMR